MVDRRDRGHISEQPAGGDEQPASPPESVPFRLEPTAGPAGTTVAIYGSFRAADRAGITIVFPGLSPVRPSHVSDGRVLVVVPEGAGSGALQVIVGGDVVFAQQFTVTAVDDGLFIPTSEDRGLLGEVYMLQPNTRRLPDFRTLGQPVATIVVPALQVKPRRFDSGFPGLGAAGQTLLEWFAIRFSGYIAIASPGEYRFRLNSDDGARLYIDNQLVVDNDGVHPPRAKDGAVRLEPGAHEIAVEYFQGPRHQIALELWWNAGTGWERVPDTVLSRSAQPQPVVDCSQPRRSMPCCKALTPACQECARRARAARRAWEAQCNQP